MPLSKHLSSHGRLSENVDMNRVAPNQLLTIRETRNLKGYFKFRKNLTISVQKFAELVLFCHVLTK